MNFITWNKLILKTKVPNIITYYLLNSKYDNEYMKHIIKKTSQSIIYLLIVISFFSCNQPSKNVIKSKREIIIKKNNTIITYSSDIKKLGRILNLKDFKPTNVYFKSVFHDNLGSGERISVPGPSDFYLQAILYFDSTTFQRLTDQYKLADYQLVNYSKNEFKFKWLNKKTLHELNNSKQNYSGHPNFFFTKKHDKAWFLDEKILLTIWMN